MAWSFVTHNRKFGKSACSLAISVLLATSLLFVLFTSYLTFFVDCIECETTNGNVTVSAGPDLICTSGEIVNFSGLVISSSPNPILNYTWDFGDGSFAYEANTTHVYLSHGIYIVKFTATDGSDTATDTAVVIVKNSPPNFIRPYDMNVLEDIDSSLNISNYITDIDDPLEKIKIWTSSQYILVNGKVLTFRYSIPITEEVTIYVSDGENTVSQTITVTVMPRNDAPQISPIPIIECSPEVPSYLNLSNFITDEDNSLEELAVSTSSSYIHVSGLLLTLTYPFGIDHEFVNLTVFDGYSSAKTQFVVLVKDTSTPPVVDFTIEGAISNEYKFYTKQNVNFTSSVSDSQNDVVMLIWDFGDGTFGIGESTVHSYSEDGFYNVKLTALDATGKVAFCIRTIEVMNRPPVAQAVTLQTIRTYQAIEFDATNSYDPDGTITNYTWEWRDGTLSFGAKCTHSYSTKGTYLVILRVIDDDGSFSELYIPITVENTPPIAILNVPGGSFLTYENITFTASLSYDPDGLEILYKYDFGDGIETDWISQSSVTHAYTDGTKTYFVKLSVRDRDGAIDTTSVSVNVQNRAPKLEQIRVSDGTVGKPLDIYLVCEDVDGKIVRVEWDFNGDGILDLETTNANMQSHTFDKSGVYNIKVRIFDDDGAKDSLTESVLISEKESACSPFVLAAILVCVLLISIPLFLGTRTQETEDKVSSTEQLITERESATVAIRDAENALEYARQYDENADFSDIEALIQQAKISLGKNNPQRALNLATTAKNEIEQKIEFSLSKLSKPKLKRGGL
ncbi:MAG: PKD domain-containing protein [Thermoplasmata archaeon]